MRLLDKNIEEKNLYNICKQLQESSSRKVKESIIKTNMENYLFKEMLTFLFDNNITTGIDIKKLNTQILSHIATPTFEDLIGLMNYLKTNNTGTLADISVVQNSIKVISDGDTDLNDFIGEIVTKSLRLGIDVKTINKVFGYSFIHTFDVQLGTPIDKVTLLENEYIYISQKLNGTRCVFYNGELWTRSGKKYTGCQHIIKDIMTMLNVADITQLPVLDGELVLKECGLSDSEAFQKGTGIANSDNETKEELKLVLFDIIPQSYFEGKSFECDTYGKRKDKLCRLLPIIKQLHLQSIDIVPMFYEGRDHNKIWKLLEYAESRDMEGIIINLDTPYEFKRTKSLIKVKKFFDIDLECIAINKGEKGKYKDTLGAIVCKYGDNVVKVGSGFTEELRDYYFNNTDKIIGKIVTVKYKEVTKNKDGTQSLQFPVFVCVREDKDVADK